jgi:hypothetical protein
MQLHCGLNGGVLNHCYPTSCINISDSLVASIIDGVRFVQAAQIIVTKIHGRFKLQLQKKTTEAGHRLN